MARPHTPAEGKLLGGSGYPVLLVVPFLLVLALNLVGLVSPSIFTWGFNIWCGAPPAFLGGVLLVALLCCIPAVANGISTSLSGFVTLIEASGAGWRRMAVACLSAVLGALFVVLRSKAPIYGDGYTVVANSVLPVFAPPETFHETIKIVPVLLYRLGGSIFTKQMHLDPQLAFGIVSSIGGVVGFWGLWRLARALGKDTGQSIALMSAGLASGCTVLFFGHLELYTWGIAILLWLLATFVEFVKGRRSAAAVWIWLVIAAAMQTLFLPTLLVIAVVLIALRRSSQDSPPSLAFGLTPSLLSWGVLLCSIGAGLFFSLVRTEFAFVHLWIKSDNPYHALSLAHLADMGNLLFLVCPCALSALVLILASRREHGSGLFGLEDKLLAVCVLSLFLVSFWLDPGLGALRDWDLLSFFGFPAAVLGALLLLRGFNGRAGESLVTSLSLCLILLVPAPHIAERTNGEKAVSRIDPMVWQDAHYLPSYDTAHGALPWAALLQTFTKQPELADRYLWRKIAVDPSASMAWYNLGEIELNRHHYDSAALVLERAYALTPENDVITARYAEALQSNGETQKLQGLLPRLAGLESDNPKALGYAGIVLATAGRLADALPLFKRAFFLRPWEFKHGMNLAMAYFQLDQYDSSNVYYRRVLPMAPKGDQPNAYRAIIQGDIRLDQLDDAQQTLDQYRTQFPDDPTIPSIQSLLNRKK